ncbi:MAG: sigW 16 [Planctomycetaceae bacterium]|nr:sigW 16 [Planctomycetaceae bacterium]
MSEKSNETSQETPIERGRTRDALGEALEACRAYLLAVADRELDEDLRNKGGASDIVQETFLEAHRDIAQFQGSSDDELRAWLRRLLLNNVSNFRRHYRDTDKRATGREVPVNSFGSSGDWRDALAADSLTPSMHLMNQERDIALERAIQRLPEDYREIILHRYRDELPFEEIAIRMNRSNDAVRKLWCRAIERLEQELGSSEA